MIHAFAMIRAVEARLGSVISIEMQKNLDDLLPVVSIFITLLRPIQLEEALYLEIPMPAISKGTNYLGGPSLDDVQAALRSKPVAVDQGTIINEETLAFHVELFRAADDGYRRPWKYNEQRRLGAEVEEDEGIVEALQQFEGGFYGGFEGLAQRFRSLAKKEGARETWTERLKDERLDDSFSQSRQEQRSSPAPSARINFEPTHDDTQSITPFVPLTSKDSAYSSPSALRTTDNTPSKRDFQVKLVSKAKPDHNRVPNTSVHTGNTAQSVRPRLTLVELAKREIKLQREKEASIAARAGTLGDGDGGNEAGGTDNDGKKDSEMMAKETAPKEDEGGLFQGWFQRR